MGLIHRIFGNGKVREPADGASTQFRESEPDATQPQLPSRNAPRRELVQVILRDTMRKHGIPSDWIECRVLSTVNRSGRQGLHVNFVVRKAHDKLLSYVFAFQDSFERELARYEPRASDWLLSLGWEFQGVAAAEMPDPHTFAQSGPAPLVPPLVNPDWKAPESGFGISRPLEQDDEHEEAQAVQAEPGHADDDVQRDLAALFAIRDAALAQPAPGPGREPESEPETEVEDDPNDFQPTQPFADDGTPVKK